jgi:hypothetical protein
MARGPYRHLNEPLHVCPSPWPGRWVSVFIGILIGTGATLAYLTEWWTR